MAFIVNLGLDPQLPLMVWSDASLLYPLDYVLSRKGRMLPASESRVQQLIGRAVRDARSALVGSKEASDHVRFRELVIDTLCREYGFISIPSAQRVILHEEIRSSGS